MDSALPTQGGKGHLPLRGFMTELKRRMDLWGKVQNFPEGEVLPKFLHDQKIYGGAQGIYVDKNKTELLTPDGAGVTVSVLHTGYYYPDELSQDGLIYHYPKTNRPKSRDLNEILATKHTLSLDLPIFVILKGKRTKLREVKLGWVIDFDDVTETFLIDYAEKKPHYVEKKENEPFQLTEKNTGTTTKTKTRPNQRQFRYQVMKNYGCKCAVCDVSHPDMLEAAHIRPKGDSGSDDWRNGIFLCKNHHSAFENRLFGIEPISMHVIPCDSHDYDRDDLQLEEKVLTTLTGKHPHQDALTWKWKK